MHAQAYCLLRMGIRLIPSRKAGYEAWRGMASHGLRILSVSHLGTRQGPVWNLVRDAVRDPSLVFRGTLFEAPVWTQGCVTIGAHIRIRSMQHVSTG